MAQCSAVQGGLALPRALRKRPVDPKRVCLGLSAGVMLAALSHERGIRNAHAPAPNPDETYGSEYERRNHLLDAKPGKGRHSGTGRWVSAAV